MRRDQPTTLDRRTHRSRSASGRDGMPAPALPEAPGSSQGLAAELDGDALPPLEAALASLRRPSWGLRFPAALETAFHAQAFEARKRHLLMCALLGILAFAFAAYLDDRLLADISGQLPWVRWPMVACMVAATAFVYRSPSRDHRLFEALFSLHALAIAATIIWSSNASGLLTAITHSVALVTIPFYICVVALQRFWFATTTTLLCLLGYTALVHGRTPDEVLIVAENTKMLWLSGTFAMAANYLFERNERLAFLLRQQDEAQRRRQEDLRNRLRHQSMIDGLTGLHNRRFLDHWLDKAWAQRCLRREPLGLLVIDVDHFKAYNDQHGHLKGDECLQQVARTVLNIAQAHQGHAVRFGGEEFLIVLPGASLEQAMHVGRTVCEQVTAAQLPHTPSGTWPVVSVSVGAASMRPTAGDEPATLIALADAALYQAKHQGRNQACAAPAQVGAAARAHNAPPPGSVGSGRSEGDPLEAMGPSPREQEVDTALRTQARWLRFPPAIERLYERTQRRTRLWQLYLIGMVCLGAFYVLAGSGALLAPDVTERMQALQRNYTLGLGLALLVLWLPLRTWQRELFFACCAALLGVAAVNVFSQSTALTVYSFSVAAFLVPAASAIAARQPLVFPCLPSVATVGAYLLLMRGHSPQGQLIVQDSAIMLSQAVLLALFGCYTLERRARVAFLLRVKGRLQRRALRVMSHKLQAMAMTDVLTGLNNRRQFDLDLEAGWEHAQDTHQAISLLLIDVDCFKAYNDHYGHLQGDQCLRQVGRVIGRLGAEVHGLPARIGGEEFGLLLPGRDTHAALAVGELLCRAVQSLAIPHTRSLAAPQVTISVGTATVVPTSGAEPRRHLMAPADEALYRAKANGRNRVMVSTRSPA